MTNKNPFKVNDRVACITNMQCGIVRQRKGTTQALIFWGTANGRDYEDWVPVVDLTPVDAVLVDGQFKVVDVR